MKNKQRAFARNFGIIVLAAVIVFSVVSCAMLEGFSLMSDGQDAADTGLSEEEMLLVGMWRSNTGHLYTFNEDRTGTVRLSGSNTDSSFTWTIFFGSLSMTIDGSPMYASYSLNGDELSWRRMEDNAEIRTTRELPGLAFTHGRNGCAVSLGTETGKVIVIPATCPQGHPVTAIVAPVYNNDTYRYEGGFAGTAITSITVPGSITTITANVFSDCENLDSIILENGVTTIGDSAFSSSTFKSITIPASVTSIGRSAFLRSFGFTSITIPASVTSIGDGAFAYNSISSITFLGAIPAAAFHTTAFGNSMAEGYMGDLREKYLAGGSGTYTRSGITWTKQ